MNKIFKTIGLVFMLFIGVFLYACGAVAVTPKISIENTYIELRIGEESESKSVDIFLTDYRDTAEVTFSTDHKDLITYSPKYLGDGKTRLTVTGVEPGTAWLTVTSLQGGATKNIEIKVIQPIKGVSLKNEYKDKIYAIKGSSLNLNNEILYNFVPTKTNEKNLEFEIITPNSGCTITNGVLYVGANSTLDKISIMARAKNNEDVFIDGFEVHILQPISSELKVGYEVANNEVGANLNNNWDLYISDEVKSSLEVVFTVTASIGNVEEWLNVQPISSSGRENFSVSQTNYRFINNKYEFTFLIQPNSLEAGKTDTVSFRVSYKNFTIGENDYNVTSNAIKISSYNSPEAVKVNQGTGSVDVDIFENSNQLINRGIEFTIFPGDIKSDQSLIRIWVDDLTTSPIYLYKYNQTRTAYILQYGYNTEGIVCSNKDEVASGATPYLEIKSGEKLYAFVNKDNYDAESNKEVTFYSQAAIYYSGETEGQKALTAINFTINPNAKEIYLANEKDGNLNVNIGEDKINLDINHGKQVVQYIAISPADFVIGGNSNVTIGNINIATVGDLVPVKKNGNYVYAKFTINILQLGSTTLKVTLSDGKSKIFTLNSYSSLEELEIRIEDLDEQIKNDIIAFTDIDHTKVKANDDNPRFYLNKISMANTGGGIQFLKRVYPSGAQYYLDYSFYDDYEYVEDQTIINTSIGESGLSGLGFKETSNILNATMMRNFRIIQAVNSKTEGPVILRINVYGVEPSGQREANPIGTIYYLIDFFIPVASLNISNSVMELYPYNLIGDKAIDADGNNLSIGNFSVAINSSSGGVNPTYIDTLQIYVNGKIPSINFTNNICYLDADGNQVYSSSEAVLKIVRTRMGNVFNFNVQAFSETNTNYVFSFIVTEVGNRKITGVSRIFIKDVTEISHIVVENVDEASGIYFQNKGYTNGGMKLELVTNIAASENKPITNKNLHFEFDFEEMYKNGVETTSIDDLVKITSKNGNYQLVVDKSFSGVGRIIIYPESDYFNSGRDVTGMVVELPILIAAGESEGTAIRINYEKDIELLNDSSLYYSLESNLNLKSAMIENFSGSLDGGGWTVSVQGPLFANISNGGSVSNLTIIALPSTYVDATGVVGIINAEEINAFGFLACWNAGTITDVNIQASTTHLNFLKDTEDKYILNAIGLLVGVNEGTITYTKPNYDEYEQEIPGREVNIEGDISNVPTEITYTGGVVGYDSGSIKRARVDIITGKTDNTFSSNKNDAVFTGTGADSCAIGGVPIDELNVVINEEQISAEDKTILYYYNVIGAALSDSELGELRKRNTQQLGNLFEINAKDNTSGYFSNFRFTSNKNSVVEVFGNSLRINGVGKAELTITPKYPATEDLSITITIYIIYPINDYKMYEGKNTEEFNVLPKNNAEINVKKSGEAHLTSYVNNTIPINGKIYIITQNNLALKLYVNNDSDETKYFEFSGSHANYTPGEGDNASYYSTGTIAVMPTVDAEVGNQYELFSNLVLQGGGGWNDVDYEIINNLLVSNFKKQIGVSVYVGAEGIDSSIQNATIDPSTVQVVSIDLTTDNSDDDLKIEIKDAEGNILGTDGILRDSQRDISFKENIKKFELLIYVNEARRADITISQTFVVYVYAESEESVCLSITITVNPQEISSITYNHYNRDDKSSQDGLVPQSEPSYVLAPGDNGLLTLNIFPTYATYSKIVIESSMVDGNYIFLDQMYLKDNIYLPTSGNSDYSSFRNQNKLTINYSDGLKESDGMVYIRTQVANIGQGTRFPLILRIYRENDKGEDVLIESKQIYLVTQIVDGPTISINDEKDAVVVRGFDNEIKISVPAYQDLHSYNIEGHTSAHTLDYIRIDIDRASYEIIEDRKVFTGKLYVGLNAEIYGDGEFEVSVMVSRIINGRLETSVDKIKVKVVDFLVEGIYIEGNNEDDNVFDTPLAIEKELTFKFELTKLPNYYDSFEETAVNRIKNAQQYFLDHMAYKYANGDYSYIINTDRVFVGVSNTSNPKTATHEVSSQTPDTIAHNLYYANSATPYIKNEKNTDRVVIRYNGLNDLEMKSNLLKVTGAKTGSVQFTIRIPYQLPKQSTVSYITYNFSINVQTYSDEDKPTPIYDEQDFIDFLSQPRENYGSTNYIIMDNITLTNFIPFETTYFSSLDGNNKVITIKNFNTVSASSSGILELALFNNISPNTTLKNITLNLYQLEDIIIDENTVNSVNIAGITVRNYGVVYNCEVVALDINNVGVGNPQPGIRVYFDGIDKNKLKRESTYVNIAGLVMHNYEEGCITNSRVGGLDNFVQVTWDSANQKGIEKFIPHKNINIIGQGDIAGFVLENDGVISASYFANGSIINNSSSGLANLTSGFVLNNNMYASINGSYSKGIKLSSDSGPYITGGGIVAQGIVSGFVFLNEGYITDSYSNIRLAGTNSAGRIVSGFVYNNKNQGLVERCYSASTIVGELTTQMPFSGKNDKEESMQNVENGLINCYYIIEKHSSDAVLEEKYNTGAVALAYSTLSKDKLYGFSFVSSSQSQDGSWHWTGIGAELIEANNIAISARYVIEDYSEKISGGSSIEELDVFPYIKGYEYGSAKNPIIIRTADEYNRVFGQETSLRPGSYYAISQMYDKARGVIFGSYRLVSHIDFQDLTMVESVKITSSIMNLTKKDNLRGVFDGNGLTITNIEITLNNKEVVGFLSKLSGSAVFKNVNLEILKVASSEGVYVGGAVGQVENSSMSNIKVSPINTEIGSDKSSVSGYNIVGGVVGFVVGNSRLSNLTSHISVNSLFKSSISEYGRFGQSLTHHKGLSYAGGVIGLADIYNSVFDNGVYTSTPSINKLTFSGENVTVQGKFVGGIAGYIGVSTYLVDALFEITGNVSGNVFNQKLISYGNTKYQQGETETTANASIGGIVAVNYGNLLEVRIEHESEVQKDIENNMSAYYKSNTSYRGGLSKLFNGIEASSVVEYMGGLVGQMMKGTLNTSYAKIDVVSDNAKYAGGLIGYNNTNFDMFEVFAFGDVDARVKTIEEDGEEVLSGISGGLVGRNTGTIQLSLAVAMNYYNKNHSRFFELWAQEVEEGEEPSTTPEGLGSIVGKDGKNDSAGKINFAGAGRVFAVTDLTIIGKETLTLSNGVKEYEEESDNVSDLSITSGDLGKFNNNVDIINANEMFLNSGWDSSLWIKDDDRIFPYFNFGLGSLTLYIEKPSDFAKIFKYNKQSNEVIIGNDPDTLFNPYLYEPDNPATFYEFTAEELEGLSVDGETITFNISKVDFGEMEEGDSYIGRFLGKFFGEDNDWNYVITGFERTLFSEIIGGEIRKITFDGLDGGNLNSSVLAEKIHDETKLNDLTFKNIKINTEKNQIGIMTESLENISSINNVTIGNSSIIVEKDTEEGVDNLYVGGLSGKSTGAGENYPMVLNNVVIKDSNIKITAKGDIYTGMMFGQTSNLNATYTDCQVSESRIEASTSYSYVDEEETITVTVYGNIYAGGFVGQASGSNLRNTKAGTDETYKIVDNLSILIGDANKLNAGLLFGESPVNTLKGGTPGDLDANVSGLITNKYKYDGEDIVSKKKDDVIVPVIAQVGGIVGIGSGNISGIDIGSKGNVLIDLEVKTKESLKPDDNNAGITEFATVGGAIGNASTKSLNLAKITVSGKINVTEAIAGESSSLIIAGGLVGYIGNTFTISSNIVSADVKVEFTGTVTGTGSAIVYAGGVVGYSHTLSTGTFNFGGEANGEINTSLSNKFEGNLEIKDAKKIYAGGIIGTSNNYTGTASKIAINNSQVSGNIKIDSIQSGADIKIGGVAGAVIADMKNNYAWGNIKLEDDLSESINSLYLGGIVGALKGSGLTFTGNNSLTSMYNENRATGTGTNWATENHSVRALVGTGSGSIKTDDKLNNYYCHQINLCVDIIGGNLAYNSTGSGKVPTGDTILSKFGSLTNGAKSGSKLNPTKLTSINYNSITIEEGQYYVLTGIVAASSSKTVNGHLVGDGYTINADKVDKIYMEKSVSDASTTRGSLNNITSYEYNNTIKINEIEYRVEFSILRTGVFLIFDYKYSLEISELDSNVVVGIPYTNNITFKNRSAYSDIEQLNYIFTENIILNGRSLYVSIDWEIIEMTLFKEMIPFETISGFISGLNVINNNRSSTGVAVENTGIVFAVIANIDGGRYSYVNSGFVETNSGLISDSSVVMQAGFSGGGFVGTNSGIVVNSYVTGASSGLSGGVATFGVFGGKNVATTTGTFINCYVSLKAGSAAAAFYGKNIVNCYYDRNAAEKALSGTGKTTDDMSSWQTEASNHTGILGKNSYNLVSSPEGEETGIWAQNFGYNFGYPTLSAGAYKNFDYLKYSTGSNPIQIPNAGKLNQINEKLGANYRLINNLNISNAGLGTNYTASWTPIRSFTGELDGGSKTISGIPSISSSNAGFFEEINGGTVERLTLTYVSGATVGNGNGIAGGVTALLKDSGSIKNVTVTGAVIKGNVAGGIVGNMYSGEISDVRNNATVTATVTATGTGYAGGIVGYMSNGVVSGSTNSASAVVTATTYAGGIVGQMGGDGIVQGYGSGDRYEDDPITENKASVNGKIAGGIVGRMEETSRVYGLIERDSSSQELKYLLDIKNSGSINGDEVAGGIVGICNSSNNDFNVIFCCENKSKVSSFGMTGGIVGQITSNDLTISHCNNGGTVITTKASNPTALQKRWHGYAGGIVGCIPSKHDYTNVNVIIQFCENTAAVVCEGSNYRKYFAGGILGSNYKKPDGENTSGYEQTGTIDNCKNSGDIYIANRNSSGVGEYGYGGGIAGADVENIRNCDTDTSKKVYRYDDEERGEFCASSWGNGGGNTGGAIIEDTTGEWEWGEKP